MAEEDQYDPDIVDDQIVGAYPTENVKLSYPFYRQNEVRYWLHFTARRYSNRRAQKAAGGRPGKLVDITLPMPTNMNSTSNVNYEIDQSNETPFIEVIQSSLSKLMSGDVLGAGRRLLGGVLDPLAESIIDLTVGGNLGRVSMDTGESLFQSANPRTFNFSFALIARNAAEASAIGRIAKAFESYALPFPATSLAGNISANAMIHPPLWTWSPYTTTPTGFGFAQTKDENANLEFWTSSPQTSVLTQVSVDKTPLNGIFASSNDAPIATIINLQYLELEPNMNVNGRIRSRSSVTSKAGSSIDASGLFD